MSDEKEFTIPLPDKKVFTVPYTLELLKPVKHGEKEVDKLVFARDLVAGDLRGIPMSDMCFDHIVLIASRITGYPPSVLNELSFKDFAVVGEIVTSFL